jgi:hypothetical protein
LDETPDNRPRWGAQLLAIRLRVEAERAHAAGGTIMCLIAYAMASAQLETGSLERILPMWAFTMAIVITMASAICWLL